MAALCVAIGNVLRGDDGVAHRVAQLVGDAAEVLTVIQLTPEIAAQMARFDTVVFIDADVSAPEPHLEPVESGALRGTPLAHAMAPGEVVCLARRLFGFMGAAFICRIPAASFEAGTGLSSIAEASALRAAELVGSAVSGCSAQVLPTTSGRSTDVPR